MKEVYVMEAIWRNKDNPHATLDGPRVIRMVAYHGVEEATTRLREIISNKTGTWRIYRSVNKRDIQKAEKYLMHKMIDRVDEAIETRRSIESVWKTALMQPANKSERLFLLDIDTKDSDTRVDCIRASSLAGGYPILEVETPNGFHVITQPFDPRVLSGFPFVSIVKDALVFVELIDMSPVCESSRSTS